MPQAPIQVALVASRVRNDEKLLIGALERQAVPFTVVDSRTMWLELGSRRPQWTIAVNREI
ncbi:hypothetical protein ACFQ1S_27220, partial [Kibdelosporangium lantanae]